MKILLIVSLFSLKLSCYLHYKFEWLYQGLGLCGKTATAVGPFPVVPKKSHGAGGCRNVSTNASSEDCLAEIMVLLNSSRQLLDTCSTIVPAMLSGPCCIPK